MNKEQEIRFTSFGDTNHNYVYLLHYTDTNEKVFGWCLYDEEKRTKLNWIEFFILKRIFKRLQD